MFAQTVHNSETSEKLFKQDGGLLQEQGAISRNSELNVVLFATSFLLPCHSGRAVCFALKPHYMCKYSVSKVQPITNEYTCVVIVSQFSRLYHDESVIKFLSLIIHPHWTTHIFRWCEINHIKREYDA